MCGRGFKLKIKTKMRGAEGDEILAVTANLAQRLKTDWDWHRGPKGEIWQKLGENHACCLQADLIACYDSNRKN